MGPRARARGNLKATTDCGGATWLQWGRERALAEMERDVDAAIHKNSASMGPRARARGNPQGYPPPCGRYPASMGPRARARGNGAGRRAALEGQGASMGPRARARGN